jgi:hypothetical protein
MTIDFGQIHISNETSQVQGRWQKKPDEKVHVQTMRLEGHGLTMSY